MLQRNCIMSRALLRRLSFTYLGSHLEFIVMARVLGFNPQLRMN